MTAKNQREGNGAAQIRNTGEKVQILVLEIRFLHSDLIQNKAYPKHLPYLRHTHMPNSPHKPCGKGYDSVYKPVPVQYQSLEMPATTCPVNGSSKAIRFPLMMLIAFEMRIIDRGCSSLAPRQS